MRRVLIKRPRPEGRSREIQGSSLLTSSTGTPRAYQTEGGGRISPPPGCLPIHLLVVVLSYRGKYREVRRKLSRKNAGSLARRLGALIMEASIYTRADPVMSI